MHICTGTGLTRCHICTGTGIACRICAATSALKQAARSGSEHCPFHVASCTVRSCMLHVACCMWQVASCTSYVAWCMVRVAWCTLRVACCVLRVACCRSRRRHTSSVDSDADSVRVRPTEKRRSPHSCKSAPPPPPQLSLVDTNVGKFRIGEAERRVVRACTGGGMWWQCVRKCRLMHAATCCGLHPCCNLLRVAIWNLAWRFAFWG